MWAVANPESHSNYQHSMSRPSHYRRLDWSTIAGLVVAFFGIGTGGFLEGIGWQDLLHLSPFLIVVGGTASGVLISTTWKTLCLVARNIELLFIDDYSSHTLQLDIINGILQKPPAGFTSKVADVKSFARRAPPRLLPAELCSYDEVDRQFLRDRLELEVELDERFSNDLPQVLGRAAGYAPTAGVVAAVIGLMHVMQNFHDLQQVGRGIAVAFSGTIYGLLAANVIFLPCAGKLQSRLAAKQLEKKWILAGLPDRRTQRRDKTFGEASGKTEIQHDRKPAAVPAHTLVPRRILLNELKEA